ncbi:Nn.00g066430.m01.CDS01 [Neocucurbitaria sp. VM-36]
MDIPERITGWLEDLHITNSDKNKSESVNEFAAQKERFAPTTPERKVCVYEAPDNSSPTDTLFSETSVFDTPLRKYAEPRNVRPSNDKTDDDTSDITSVDGKAWELHLKTHQDTDDRISSPNATQIDTASSIVSSTTSSELSTTPIIIPSPLSAVPPRDPNSPRTVWIASCLQCTLSGLPCSRTPPSCSRCKRKGQAKICLLQRRWLSEEISLSQDKGCTVPKLLKLRGEDEEVWGQKVDVARELFEEWRAEQDRRNWVLPSVESPRGGYPVFGCGERVSHPGEGSGQVVHAELSVDLDV